MFKTLAGLSLWLIAPVVCTAATPASAATPATPTAQATSATGTFTITFAEHHVRLVRDTSVYGAGRGVALQPNDMVETTNSAIQLDLGGRPIAVGPASRFLVKNAAQLILLDGWMKVADTGKQPLTVGSAHIELADLAATTTMHVAADTTELFAESADLMVHETGAGAPPRRTKLPREQFAYRTGTKPMVMVARPPARFLTAMPRVFMEPLTPLVVKGAPVAPKRERAAVYAELAPWLAGHPALRQQVQRRFAPPRQARPKPATTTTNYPSDQF